MNRLTEGSPVTCGICNKETTVSFVTDRQGTMGYDLGCQHRNAYCGKCNKLVRDVSEVIQEVHAHCDTCDGSYYDD